MNLPLHFLSQEIQFLNRSAVLLFLVAELSDCDQQVVTIYQGVHRSRHNESGEHIEDGVLFDEHGRHDDRRSQNQGSDADALFFSKHLLRMIAKCAPRELYT